MSFNRSLAMLVVVFSSRVFGAMPTTQPAGQETRIQMVMIDFKPNLFTRPNDIRRQLETVKKVGECSTALKKLGESQALSGPSLQVAWPREATISVGTVLHQGNRAALLTEFVGWKSSITGSWLENDPTKARVHLEVDYSYPTGASSKSTNITPVAHDKIVKEVMVTNGKTSWLVVPWSSKSQQHYCIVGLVCDREKP